MKDSSCRKCGAEMDDATPPRPGALGRLFQKITTAYLCEKCGHWNNLKLRKANKKRRAK